MTSLMEVVPSTSIMHCCSPNPSGVPGTWNPREILGSNRGSFSAGFTIAHTTAGGAGRRADSWRCNAP